MRSPEDDDDIIYPTPICPGCEQPLRRFDPNPCRLCGTPYTWRELTWR